MFRNVGSDVVCTVATWNGNTLQIQSDPFLIEKIPVN